MFVNVCVCPSNNTLQPNGIQVIIVQLSVGEIIIIPLTRSH